MIEIAICDDEPLAIKELSELITAYACGHNYKVRQTAYSSGEGFLEALSAQNKQVDILFLDIKMEGTNGIETAKRIRQIDESMMIVFVSVLYEYVFDVFDVEAKGFLVKPIEKKKVYDILEKSFLKLEQNRKCYLDFCHGGKAERIPLKNIYYCDVQNHSVLVYEREKIHKYQGKIDDLEKELDGDFFRCHRSFIINLRFVSSYGDNIIFMQSGEKIPVAGRRQKAFMKALLHFQRKEVR